LVSSRPHAADLLIQPYIESNSTDYRIFVVGNKVAAAMKRKGSGIEFRSNVAKGGNGEKIEPTKEMKQMAIKATKILGLDYAGVDIIKDKNGKNMIVEVNSNPGLEIEKITDTKYSKRNIPVIKGDKVRIMKGEFKNKTGKISLISNYKLKVAIEGIQKAKKDGTKVNVYFWSFKYSNSRIKFRR